jgi:nucleoside-diphosphate-sugar epimerase
MKSAIVTGATGFIGSNLVASLTELGINVLAVGRKELVEVSIVRQEKLKNATYVCLNMSEIFQLKKRVDEYGWSTRDDCVFINLAWGGEKSLSDQSVESQLKNVGWSVNALETAHSLGCIKFLQIGTMEEAFTYEYLELDHHSNNEFNRHVIYSVAKIAAKKALKIRANQLNIDFIYVLHSHVMGPDDDKDSFLQVTLNKLRRNEKLVFSSGEQYFDVISISDCCDGYIKICEKGVAGSEYWVGSGQPRRLREYVEIMYSLYPSEMSMEFGSLPYNDIKINVKDFSIELLQTDTGFFPRIQFEDIVHNLHSFLSRVDGVN